MTTDAEKLAVMEGAIRDGKRVEWRPSCGKKWYPCTTPLWDWESSDYRLAPERKKAKGWVNVYREGPVNACSHDEEVVARMSRRDDWHPIAIAVPVEFEYEEGYGLEDRT